MNCAFVSLSAQGATLAANLARHVPADIFVHETARVPADAPARRFSSVLELTRRIFSQYNGLVYFAPCGVVVRAIAPLASHKLTDPAVVVVDAFGRHAISLLSGHEGGANDLALRVANALDAEPVVTTTTEALKTLIVGVGCRRGTPARDIVRAVRQAMRLARVKLEDVRLLASADLKATERGLLDAARQLKLPVRFIASDALRTTTVRFQRSKFVQSKVNLPAVAEPAALLAGRRTQLLLPRTIFPGITVAVARENCSPLASGPAGGSTAPTAPKRRSRPARLSAATRSTSRKSPTSPKAKS